MSLFAGSKLRSDQFRFGRMLAELQGQPLFSLRQFESTIDTIRDCVAEVRASASLLSLVQTQAFCKKTEKKLYHTFVPEDGVVTRLYMAT